MVRFVRNHVTSAHALALTALFVALGGGAYAAKLKPNTVKSKQVKDNSMKSVDVKDGALTGADIADGSVTGADVDESTLTLPAGGGADGAGTGAAGGDLAGSNYPNPVIKNGAITTTKIADNAVEGAKIAPDTISSSDVANGGITGDDVQESSLGTVPSATTADSANSATLANNANNATNAANADKLDNKDSSEFVQGSATVNQIASEIPGNTFDVVLLTVPGEFRIEAGCNDPGAGDATPGITFRNISAEQQYVNGYYVRLNSPDELTDIPIPGGVVAASGSPFIGGGQHFQGSYLIDAGAAKLHDVRIGGIGRANSCALQVSASFDG